MTRLNSHLDVLNRLPKTNCRECRQASCLAFSVAVFQGKKTPADCPYIVEEGATEGRKGSGDGSSLDRDAQKALENLQRRIQEIDLAGAAERCGAVYRQGVLTLACLGKSFSVDAAGVIRSDCHVNRWVSVPILNYILECQGREPRGGMDSAQGHEGRGRLVASFRAAVRETLEKSHRRIYRTSGTAGRNFRR